MSKKPETIFAERVDKTLRARFGKNIWLENIQQVGKIGTPDRLICLRGRFIGLELKTEIGQPSKLQFLKLLQIKKAGGLAYLVNPSNLDEAVNDMDRATRAFDCSL